MSDVIVLGGGGHARVVAGIARRDGVLALAGYTDLHDRGPLDGLPYLGTDDALAGRSAPFELLLGVGLVANAPARWALYRDRRAAGLGFVRLVSRRASVAAETELGEGTVVLDFAVVNPGAVLGAACIVNTGAVVEHDCRLGDNVHVSPHATLCGGVTVGDHCLIGAGATIVPGVTIAAGCIVGAGAVVAADLAQSGTYLGAPAIRRGEGMPA
jgi:sugar O-acyltransferase (sialic acid O-acetyltransferase NeuD family)